MSRLIERKLLSIHDNNLSGCAPIELSVLWVHVSGLELCDTGEVVGP